jgi:hypothetical protein
MAWPSTTISTVNMDATTDSPAAARPEIKQMADNINTIQGARGASDGIASTDSGGKVPTAQLPIIPANQGGTGQTVFNVGDVLFANTTSTLQKLSAGAVSYVLTSNGPGAAPSWQQAGGGLVAGTRLAFQQTTAPLGWTKETNSAFNDCAMRIVTGTVGSGGVDGFTTVFGSGKATASHALTISQMPSHGHAYTTYSGVGGSTPKTIGNYLLSTTINPNVSGSNSAVMEGGGLGHTHNLTLDIKYRDFIIATKD